MSNTYTNKQRTVGVVIGRFQVARLHVGHRHLLDVANHENDELCILLGSTGGAPTKRNPLSFSHRKEMVTEMYPKAKVFEIIDSRRWSENLDAFLQKTFPNKKVRLYGSRDSFAKEYFGALEVVHVPPLYAVSGTEMRNMVVNPKEIESFRQGIIESHKSRYPISYQTVDIAIMDAKKETILLGRKKDGDWHFPGGFVDTTDESLEVAATRELSEEVPGLKLSEPLRYVGSYRMHDHRYRNEEDKILTALFISKTTSTRIRAGDDLEEVKWFSLEEAKKHISPTHTPLLASLIKALL